MAARCCLWSVVVTASLWEVLTGGEREMARLRNARTSIFEKELREARVMVLTERLVGWICG